MKTLTFTGNIVDGKMTLEDKSLFQKSIQQFDGMRVFLDIQRWFKKRTKAENRYYWAILNFIGSEWGETKDRMHDFFGEKFLKTTEWKQGKHDIIEFTFTKSTTKMTTVEFENYLENIRVWALKEMELYVPKPGEPTLEKFIETYYNFNPIPIEK